MKTGRSTRRVAASLGIAAIISMGALTACGGEEKEAPSETSTTTTTPPRRLGEPDGEGATARSRTDRTRSRLGVKAPPAPTALPGDN